MNSSLTTHGALTESSLIDHIGKGREGKGRGWEGPECVSHASTDLLGRAFADACNGWHPSGETCCEWSARPTFALNADLTVYWPDVRPCWEER